MSLTEYERATAQLEEVSWSNGLPCALRNALHRAGITCRQQLLDYQESGGRFTRFEGVGVVHELLLNEWLASS